MYQFRRKWSGSGLGAWCGQKWLAAHAVGAGPTGRKGEKLLSADTHDAGPAGHEGENDADDTGTGRAETAGS